jgi:carbon-monoxide dehydrogenase small subunit
LHSTQSHVSDPVKIGYRLNGAPVTAEVEPRALLVHHLREDRRLVGAHVGCDTSQCGACAVLVDGRAVKSCSVLAVQVDGKDVVTVEGVAGPDGLHPVQEALHRHHGAQCGFCTPGMVVCAIDMLENAPPAGLDEKAIRHGLAGNICRCTGYQNIVAAIAEVAAARQGATA